MCRPRSQSVDAKAVTALLYFQLYFDVKTTHMRVHIVRERHCISSCATTACFHECALAPAAGTVQHSDRFFTSRCSCNMQHVDYTVRVNQAQETLPSMTCRRLVCRHAPERRLENRCRNGPYGCHSLQLRCQLESTLVHHTERSFISRCS